MRILWVFNHPAPYKIDFFNELGKSVDLTVLFERGSESDRNKLFYYEKPSSFRMFLLNSLPLGPHNGWTREIKDHLRHEVYDIIVMNGYSTFSEMNAIGYLHRHHIPYVFAINGGIVRHFEWPFKRHLKRKYISGAALYLCPDANSENYLTFYGAKKGSILRYPYSTVFEREIRSNPTSSSERTDFWKEEGIPGSAVYLAVGQFIKRKNLLQLLDYWTKVDEKRSLVLLGSGPLKKKLEAKIQKLGLHNVFFKDYKPHPETLHYLSMCTASIFLTKEDIYGHVVNESLTQGAPVIGSRHANAALALLKDGYNGFLIEDDDEESFLKAVKAVDEESFRAHAIESSKEETIEEMARFHLEAFAKMNNR